MSFLSILLNSRMQLYSVVASLITAFVITIADVIVVSKIIKTAEAWNLVSYWHFAMLVLAVSIAISLIMTSGNLLPGTILILYFLFQIEDIVYMNIATWIGWQDSSWTALTYQWTWLDYYTISYYVSLLLGFQSTTTLSVLITSAIGTILILYLIIWQTITLKLCLTTICKMG